MNTRVTLLSVPLILFIISSVMVALGILNGWFGDAKDGIMVFCEHARSGYIKQPANSISNLAFSMAGIFMAWVTYKDNFSAKNRMTATIYLPLLLSCSLIVLGAGSFAMHATNTALGGFLDLFGMFLLSSFVSSYAITRWFKLSGLGFSVMFILSVSIGSYIKLTSNDEIYLLMEAPSLWFAIQLTVAIIFEVMLRYMRKIEINEWLGWASVFTILIAFVIWNLSRTQESILCDPHLWLQGHAVWHILDAVGACFVFLFYTTEVDPSMQ